MVFFTKYIVVDSDVPLKHKANGFPLPILLANRSMHVRHSENLKILLSPGSNAFLFNRHVPCNIFVVNVFTLVEKEDVIANFEKSAENSCKMVFQ